MESIIFENYLIRNFLIWNFIVPGKHCLSVGCNITYPFSTFVRRTFDRVLFLKERVVCISCIMTFRTRLVSPSSFFISFRFIFLSFRLRGRNVYCNKTTSKWSRVSTLSESNRLYIVLKKQTLLIPHACDPNPVSFSNFSFSSFKRRSSPNPHGLSQGDTPTPGPKSTWPFPFLIRIRHTTEPLEDWVETDPRAGPRNRDLVSPSDRVPG